jgi:Uma2 family endonuclease
MQLSLSLGSWIKAESLGVLLAAPCDVILDDTAIVEPDLLFVSADRGAIITERGIEGPPDLVVEILSDSTTRRDRGAKMKLYARYGVARYWLVDVDTQCLEVHALRDGAYMLAGAHRGSDAVACDVPARLTLRLGEIWPR